MEKFTPQATYLPINLRVAFELYSALGNNGMSVVLKAELRQTAR